MISRLLSAGVVALVPLAVLAQVPAGGEFQVNAQATGSQSVPRVATVPDGRYILVWNSIDNNGYSLRGRAFDAAGAALGAEFQASTQTGNDIVGLGAVAADAKGNFVVTWSQPDGSNQGTFAQRFNASGSPSGAAFRVNTYTTQPQTLPAAGMDARGNFVVVWQSDQDGSSYGIFGQRFDAAGVRLGGEFAVNVQTLNAQDRPAMAMDGSGNFVVAWDGFDSNGVPKVWARRFSSTGAPLGGDFRLSTQTAEGEVLPALAYDTQGNFVASWHQGTAAGTDIFARHFDASGAPRGAAFRANTYTTGVQEWAGVGLDSGGNAVVSWHSVGQDGSAEGVYAARFTSAGLSRGGEFRVNTYTTQLQGFASAASDGNGNFLVTWFGSLPGGEGFDIGAQRYGGLRPSALAVNSTGNQVWEPGETAVVRPSWRNVNGAPQTFGGNLSNLTGPAGAVYTITDGTASYGTVANNATAPCVDCYQVSVSDPTPRPSLHWDASAAETITPDALGQHQIWRLHIGRSFGDVLSTNAFYRFIETLLHHGITTGCGGGNYCPSALTTRDAMAVFVLLAKEGAGYSPPACTTPIFNDVPASNPFCRYIEELARRGVVSGCGGGNYCPGDAVTREQMPIFVLRTLDPTLNPPACGTPMFGDVPASSPFCRWIEELARRGVVTGCGGGNYCPTNPVTREQMGVFIAGTFGLVLYAP